MKALFVGGDFGELPKSSGYVNKLKQQLTFDNIDFYNGGTFSELEEIVKTIKDYNIILWFANVSNDKEKLVNSIKELNQKCILITSKNNIGDRYTFHNITARMLKVKANLCVVFNNNESIINASIIDPLMNCFSLNESDIKVTANKLESRIKELVSYTRKGTVQVGESIVVPNDEQFFNIASGYANKFHELIHAENTERYLGNLSFRCEKGFPSMRKDNIVYVSRRNVDKRDISVNGMVGVSLENSNKSVGYFGEVKPSVDSPIQVELYKYYKNINYMIHSHTYIEGATYTDKVIPCGAMEEVEEITNKEPNEHITKLFINLKGHGSIAMVNDWKDLIDITYMSRPFPEIS